MQLETFDALQAIVVVFPVVRRAGDAVTVMFGLVTVTVVLAGVEGPPGPVHVTEYDDVVAGLTLTDPEVALPVEKPPAEVQLVAEDDDQVSVLDCPGFMVLGAAERAAVVTAVQVVGLMTTAPAPPVPPV